METIVGLLKRNKQPNCNKEEAITHMTMKTEMMLVHSIGEINYLSTDGDSAAMTRVREVPPRESWAHEVEKKCRKSKQQQSVCESTLEGMTFSII